MNRRKRYSPEFQKRALWLVEEQQKEGSSEWKAIQDMSLAIWCRNYLLGFAIFVVNFVKTKNKLWTGNAARNTI